MDFDWIVCSLTSPLAPLNSTPPHPLRCSLCHCLISNNTSTITCNSVSSPLQESNKSSIDRLIIELCEHGAAPSRANEGGDWSEATLSREGDRLIEEYTSLLTVVPQDSPAASAVSSRARQLQSASRKRSHSPD
jgi:hypothetical protein